MTLRKSLNSEHHPDNSLEFESESFKSENISKNNLNNSISSLNRFNTNSNINEKSEKLSNSNNDTFLESGSIDENDFVQDSSSRENLDNADKNEISIHKKISLSFENDFVDENDFQDDFADEDKTPSSINLISMEQIEKEVDEIISNGHLEIPNISQEKPQFHVTFRPEVHERAYRNYQVMKIRRQQEKELMEYERMLQNYCAEEEEEEAEFEEKNFIDENEIPIDKLQSLENQNLQSEKAIQEVEGAHDEENNIENESSIISDDGFNEEKTVNEHLDDSINFTEKASDEEEVSNMEQALIDKSNDDQIIKDDENVSSHNENNSELEKEVENIPFIPPLDLSQFNSLKLISASQTMKKSNKIISHTNKQKRPVSSCSKIPECVIPTTNKNHTKSHQLKSALSSSPQNKSSPPKSSPPIKLESITQFENQNTSPNKSPKSLLQQVQKKSTESKAEELRNNGFLITFLQSPQIASTKQQSLPKSNKNETQDLTSILLGTATNTDIISSEPIQNLNEKEPLKEEEEIEEKKYSDEELKKAVDEMLEQHILPPNEMHTSIQIYLKNNIYKNIMDQDYDEAERLKKAQDILSNGTSQSETKNEHKIIVQSIESRIETTKDKIHELKQQWTIKMQRFEEEIQSKSDELEQKQKEEVEKFEETWNSAEILLQFNKPSAQLLEIRKMQRTKALSNDFAGARELKKRGDVLEKEETRRAERKAMLSMKNAYNQLLSKQQREFEFAKQNWQRQRNLIENERDQEIHSIELTLKQLLTKLNEFKNRPKSNSKSRSLILSSSSKINTNSSALNEKKTKSKVKRELKTPATTTPRTRKQIAKFRTEPRQEKLALNGINVHQYVKSNSKSGSKLTVSHVIREKSDF
ncbi:hypothetical protein M9Y10_017639 [Tritrichomonas musculus]|uniref:Uncharacterized protein n=1 Tax=Tritrichomonas musculus TaxID=1915356 RepID=A0ABR2HU29_9EUKA